jgi:hypothetical protein
VRGGGGERKMVVGRGGWLHAVAAYHNVGRSLHIQSELLDEASFAAESLYLVSQGV